ncbi:fibrobacter succinogenes major paralogous domain-containing protein, partial [uncultured Fibrobacter sp.]|uniref:fibrobacter succinogenes major paralogous domain-containing protein n=1 Tax=uncultured Fibrobacter sp. TaxID=261512 RepID=UPI0025974498
ENSVYLCIESAWRYLGTVAANSDELPNCTEKRNNEQAFVVEEHMTLICSESKWYRFDIYTIIEKEEVKSSSSPKQENDWEDYNPVSSSSKVTSSSSVILSSDSKSSSSNTSSTSVQSSSSSKNEAISSSSVSISSSSVILSGGEGTLKDSRDNQVYKTVTIGTQTWMAENLNYAYKGKTSTFDSSSFCYDDDPTNCSKYGRLYLWSAAMDSAGTWSTNGKGCGNGKFCLPTYPVRGVCPEGWHLPTEEDFRILSRGTGATWDERNFYYIDAGKYLKSTSGWNDNGNGTDAYGFSALPAGNSLQGGPFHQLGYIATFWSATRVIESNVDDFYSDYAFAMTLYQNSDHAFLSSQHMYVASSVRCLKD